MLPKFHGFINNGSFLRLLRITSNRIRVGVQDYLVNHQLITRRTLYLCQDWANYVGDNFLNLSPPKPRSKKSRSSLDTENNYSKKELVTVYSSTKKDQSCQTKLDEFFNQNSLKSIGTQTSNYKNVYRWFNNLKTEPLKPPTRMIICGFDNNQVIGRTCIKNQANLPSSIVTTVCYAKYFGYERLSSTEIKDKKWFNPNARYGALTNYTF
jgi:hypothetical protein